MNSLEISTGSLLKTMHFKYFGVLIYFFKGPSLFSYKAILDTGKTENKLTLYALLRQDSKENTVLGAGVGGTSQQKPFEGP